MPPTGWPFSGAPVNVSIKTHPRQPFSGSKIEDDPRQPVSSLKLDDDPRRLVGADRGEMEAEWIAAQARAVADDVARRGQPGDSRACNVLDFKPIQDNQGRAYLEFGG